MKRILFVLMLIAPSAARADDDDDSDVQVQVQRRAFLGVGLVQITPALRQHFGAPKEVGVMVGSVDEGSPAAKAGVKVADIVTAIDGQPVDDWGDLRERVRGKKQGEAVKLELVRDGKKQAVEVKLAEREVKEMDAWRYFKMPEGSLHWRGDASKAMKRAMERFQKLQGDLPKIERDLEDKMKALDERMEKLEKQLEKRGKQGGRDGV